MKEILRDPIYEQTLERLKLMGVEAVLFDLDDTLIYTGEIFERFMLEYAVTVGEQIGVETQEILEILQRISDEEYKRMGVNPARWNAVVDQLAEQFPGFENIIKGHLNILMKIYTTVPRMKAGAKTVLEVMREAGIKVGLVTHANVEWTYFKLDSLGLWDYFDQVYVVDENGHKKSLDWDQAADGLDVEPENCVIVGDSLSGDIRPGSELGARTICLPSPWAVYREGQIPKDTALIDEIFEVLAALERLR